LFFITNLVIIPMLSIILAVGVLVVILAAFNYVPNYLAKTLEWSIIILNKIIHWVASFEDFIFQNISFSFSMLLTSYLIIIGIIIWFKNPNFKKMALSLLAIISFQSVFLLNDYSTKNQKECFVFNIKKNSIITERKGNQVTIYSNDSILENIDDNLAIKSYLVGNFCEIKAKKSIQNTLYFNNKKIFILDSSSVYNPTIKPDVLIITQSPKVNLERLLQTLKPKQVVFDGSNFKTFVKRWESTCRKQKIPFHNTNEKGFYKF
jgi:competence protein ComEC